MVTRDQLREHLGRRPFRPFRVTLKNGGTIDVTRMAQAVASRREFIVGVEDHFQWIRLDTIDRVELAGASGATSSTNGD